MAITRNHQAEYQHWQPQETKLIEGRPVQFRDVCVKEIRMGDVEDPDLFVGHPIWEWQQTDSGKFVMEHAVEQPYWTRHTDPQNYGYVYRIMARFSEQNEVFWRLKWGGLNK